MSTARTERFIRNIKRSKCTKKLGSGINTAYKVCRKTSNCSECAVLKIGEEVEPYEVEFIKKLQNATRGTKYANSVIHFLSAPKVGSSLALLTEYTPNLGDMDDYFKKYTISVQIMKSILEQLFSLLDYLYDKVGFLHMDLKPKNILIAPPPDHPRVVLIDYGSSYDGKIKGTNVYDTNREFGPGKYSLYRPAFDIFRLFDCLDDYRFSRSVQNYVNSLRMRLLGNLSQYHKEDLYIQEYAMLTRKGLQRLVTNNPDLDFKFVLRNL